MNDSSGLVWLCGMCLLPFLAGAGAAVLVMYRLARYGLWGLLPLGGYWKKLIEDRAE